MKQKQPAERSVTPDEQILNKLGGIRILPDWRQQYETLKRRFNLDGIQVTGTAEVGGDANPFIESAGRREDNYVLDQYIFRKRSRGRLKIVEINDTKEGALVSYAELGSIMPGVHVSNGFTGYASPRRLAEVNAILNSTGSGFALEEYTHIDRSHFRVGGLDVITEKKADFGHEMMQANVAAMLGGEAAAEMNFLPQQHQTMTTSILAFSKNKVDVHAVEDFFKSLAPNSISITYPAEVAGNPFVALDRETLAADPSDVRIIVYERTPETFRRLDFEKEEEFSRLKNALTRP